MAPAEPDASATASPGNPRTRSIAVGDRGTEGRLLERLKSPTQHAFDYVEGVCMNMNNPVFQEASVCPKKYGREALLPGVGQPSRAIIPGDDPGDQQPPERAIIKRQRDPHVARWRIEYS